MFGLDLSVKHTIIINIYWVAISIVTLGFVFCGKEKKFRFDIYDFVLMVLSVLSVVLFILILI